MILTTPSRLADEKKYAWSLESSRGFGDKGSGRTGGERELESGTGVSKTKFSTPGTEYSKKVRLSSSWGGRSINWG